MKSLDAPVRREYQQPRDERHSLDAYSTAVRPVMSLRGESPALTPPSLDQLVEEIASTRPLQFAAAQILQLVEEEPFSAHELAQAISSDPSLMTRILRLANSPYFAFPFRVTTTRDAVMFLGFRQVRATALAISVMDAFDGASGDHDEGAHSPASDFWRHAASTALIAGRLAQAEHPDSTVPDQVFLAGFFHDIGRYALAQARPAQHRQAITLAQRGEVALDEAQRHLFGFSAAELGGALLLRWGFPADLALAIGHQADPLNTICASRLTPYQQLALLLTRASAIAAGDRDSELEEGERKSASLRASLFVEITAVTF
jgi:HD-like signal output (HDOD) protein